MKIITHRGYWTRPPEKNTRTAFERAIRSGFGIETDVRDSGGDLVISHDMPVGNEISLESFLQMSQGYDCLLALNIKADGLAFRVSELASNFSDLNYFTFDMSVPDMRTYLDLGLPVFYRLSEVEKSLTWFSECKGVWLDSFYSDWYNETDVERLLAANQAVCVVSSELHGRDYAQLWESLKPFKDHSGLYLCTDYPERARDFFDRR